MNAKSELKRYAVRIARANWTAYEFAKAFNLDYSNVCKFYREYDKLPLKIAFQILDEHAAKLVVFRSL